MATSKTKKLVTEMKTKIATTKEKDNAEKEKEEKTVNGILKKEEPNADAKPTITIEPLQPGQKYFEAPDGTIIIGESDKQQVWYRKLNNGKGGWINPKR